MNELHNIGIYDMNDASTLWHFANPNYATNLVPTWVLWSKCFPRSFILFIIFDMLPHMRNGVQNVLDMVWELKFKALDFGVLNNLNPPDFWLVGFLVFWVSEVGDPKWIPLLIQPFCYFYIVICDFKAILYWTNLLVFVGKTLVLQWAV